MHLAPVNGIYSFTRFNAAERWLIVVNKNIEDTPLTNAYLTPLLGNGSRATDAFFNTKFELKQGLLAPEKSVSIYRIQ